MADSTPAGAPTGWYTDVWFRLIRDAVAVRITHDIDTDHLARWLGIGLNAVEQIERFHPEPPTKEDCRAYIEAVTELIIRRTWRRGMDSTHRPDE